MGAHKKPPFLSPGMKTALGAADGPLSSICIIVRGDAAVARAVYDGLPFAGKRYHTASALDVETRLLDLMWLGRAGHCVFSLPDASGEHAELLRRRTRSFAYYSVYPQASRFDAPFGQQPYDRAVESFGRDHAQTAEAILDDHYADVRSSRIEGMLRGRGG